jgi:uncharacterized membrane protein
MNEEEASRAQSAASEPEPPAAASESPPQFAAAEPEPQATDQSSSQSELGENLGKNVAGALSYLLGALTGVLFLVIDRRPFVRFHAMQSIVVTIAVIALSIALGILSLILGAVPIVGWLVGLLLSLGFSVAGFVLWIYLMYRAWQGDEWEVPVVGTYARHMAERS